jgi:hypothetical protein
LEELEIEVALWVEFLKLELPNHFSLESSIKNNPTNKLKIEIKIEFIKNYVSMLSPMLLILWNDYYIGGTKYITDKEIVYNLSTNNPLSVDIKLVLVNYLEEDCHLNCCLEYNNFKELYISNFIDSKKPIQYIYNFETLKYEINRCLLFLKNELIVIPNMNKAPIQISKQ